MIFPSPGLRLWTLGHSSFQGQIQGFVFFLEKTAIATAGIRLDARRAFAFPQKASGTCSKCAEMKWYHLSSVGWADTWVFASPTQEGFETFAPVVPAPEETWNSFWSVMEWNCIKKVTWTKLRVSLIHEEQKMFFGLVWVLKIHPRN